MRAKRKRSALIAALLAVAGCTMPPDQQPALEETVGLLDGKFIGTVRIVDNYDSDNARVTSCDVAVIFLDGEYSVTGSRTKLASSRGRFVMGHYLTFLDNRTSVAAQIVIRGAFEYAWGGDLLVLSQWDEARDRLTEVLLERTANAYELLPYGTPEAVVPRSPNRRSRTASNSE